MNPIKKNLIRVLNFCQTRVHVIRRRLIAPKLPINPDGRTFVNVGCGLSTGKKFTNVDALPFSNVHYISDIRVLSMFMDDSVDLIYASHVVEHIPRSELPGVLTEWRRALKPGGVLRISVPDFDSLLAVYDSSGRQINAILANLMGQDPPYNCHYSVWNQPYAEDVFRSCGFVHPRRWDPRTAEHHEFEDRSGRMLETRQGSVPLSLNIEAEKPRR